MTIMIIFRAGSKLETVVGFWELGRRVGVRPAADEARAPERPENFG